MRRALANKDKREPQLANYTYFEHERGFDEFKPSSTDTFEIMLISDRPYRRHIAHDDKPLPPQEQQDEELKLQQERDRRMAIEGLRKGLGEQAEHPNYLPTPAVYVENELRLPLRQLPEWFVIRMTGEELIDGRKNYVLEAEPDLQHKAVTEDERNAQNLAFTLWVDEADIQLTRVEGRVIRKGFANTKQRIWTASSYPWIPQQMLPVLEEALRREDESLRAVYLPGTVFTEEWTRVNNEVWLPYRVAAEGKARNVSAFGKTKPRKVDRLRTYYDYEKFRADSRVLPSESAPSIPPVTRH